MNTRLCDYLEVNNLLSEEQNGFRAGRSCQDHIFALHTIVQNRRLLGEDTFVVFIDFKKAFDSVCRDLLWSKLQLKFNISGPFLQLLKGMYMYTSVSSCVNVNGTLTEWFDIQTGVKQGCVLSPILFSMFINDLIEDINDTNCGIVIDGKKIASLLYADDVAVIADSTTDLQLILDAIHRWCLNWGISINSLKTKAIHFRNKRRMRSQYQPRLGDAVIDYCHEYKYLGYWINEFLDVNESLNRVFAKANSAMGVIMSKSKCLGGLPFDVYVKLYKTCIIPIISYFAHVWTWNSSPLATK